MKRSLFRSEVLEARALQFLGPLFVNVPVNDEVVGWFGLSFFVFLGLGLTFVSFSEKVIVQGYVDVKPSVVQLYPKRAGVLIKRYAEIGKSVKQGEVLFVIKTGFDNMQKKETEVIKTFGKLEKTLLHDIQEKKASLVRIKQLMLKHYVSVTEYEQQKRILLNSVRQALELEQSRMRAKLDQSYVVVAPVDGVIASTPLAVGMYVKEDKPLIKIIPKHAQWIATLLIPARLLRFVHLNMQAALRYDAYPFIRFGTDTGQIQVLSQTIWMQGEQTHPIPMKEPYYQVEAAIPHPRKTLRQGMTLSAVLKGKRRTFFQWIQDLRAVKG